MPNEVSPISVANYLLAKGDKKIDPMKLVKLVYLCHGLHLGLGDGPLLLEKPQAWKYGPVIPSLYYAVRDFGRSGVKGRIYEGVTSGLPQLTSRQREIIDVAHAVYGKYTGFELSDMTHRKNTPWHKVWTKKRKNAVIPDDEIKQHFAKMLRG